jgi:archaellum biogenesis ATPase FlaH
MTKLTPQEFFSLVWPARLVRQEKIELRARRRDTKEVTREFFDSVEDFLQGAKAYKKFDVYFGVSTRFGRGGKKKDCYRLNTLWVDFDGLKLEDCQDLSPQPNILVDSGGGVHAYWLLTSSVVVRDTERVRSIEAITRGLAERFDGDTQAIDISRILRVPGYLNHKYDSLPEVKAYLIKPDPYSVDFFKRLGIYSERTEDPGDVIGSGKVIKNLPERIKKALNKAGGDSHDGDRSRQDSAVITAMLSSGLSVEDTYSTFMASPRGEDAIERKMGHVEDYVQRTIRKSLAYIHKASKNGASNNGDGTLKVDFGRKIVLPDKDGIITQRASEIEVETVRWLWPLYIPSGRITILGGDPGNGKSTIGLDLVSRISRGTFLPFSGREYTGNCLVASAEDAAQDTIVPRLIASKANLSRVEVMRQVMIDGEPRYLSFPRDLNAMYDLIVKKGARLVVIDPLNAFLSGDVDSYRDQDIRGVLAPVENMAEETGAAILIIAHYNKKEEGTPLHRIGGSIGFTGAARSVLGVQQLEGKSTRVLYSIKSNLGKQPSALEYDIVSVSKTRSKEGDWLGDNKIKSSGIKWISEVDFNPMNQEAVQQDQAEETARAFLKQVIFDAPVKTEEIFKEARSAGISKGQLFRLRDSIGVIAKQNKKDKKWYWSWPDPSSS